MELKGFICWNRLPRSSTSHIILYTLLVHEFGVLNAGQWSDSSVMAKVRPEEGDAKRRADELPDNAPSSSKKPRVRSDAMDEPMEDSMNDSMNEHIAEPTSEPMSAEEAANILYSVAAPVTHMLSPSTTLAVSTLTAVKGTGGEEADEEDTPQKMPPRRKIKREAVQELKQEGGTSKIKNLVLVESAPRYFDMERKPVKKKRVPERRPAPGPPGTATEQGETGNVDDRTDETEKSDQTEKKKLYNDGKPRKPKTNIGVQPAPLPNEFHVDHNNPDRPMISRRIKGGRPKNAPKPPKYVDPTGRGMNKYQAIWIDNFGRVEAFRKEEGRFPQNNKSSSPEETRLYKWLKANKKGGMTYSAERMKILTEAWGENWVNECFPGFMGPKVACRETTAGLNPWQARLQGPPKRRRKWDEDMEMEMEMEIDGIEREKEEAEGEETARHGVFVFSLHNLNRRNEPLWDLTLEEIKEFRENQGRFPLNNKSEGRMFSWLQQSSDRTSRYFTQFRMDKLNDAFGEGWMEEAFAETEEEQERED